MSFLSQNFLDYIAENCDRASFIQNYLNKRGVDTNLICLDGKKHILIQFNSRFYNPAYKIKTIISHYDRVEGSPGANDNSACNFMLMNWAVNLIKFQGFHNVRIFFTDGEELGKNYGVSEQGAFGLASTFKRLGITNDDVYVFDSCGRGDVALLSDFRIPEKASKVFSKKYMDLYKRSKLLLQQSCPGHWISLPAPYSDNASFLACGIPAVAITILPGEEASQYAMELLKNPRLEASVLNRASGEDSDLRKLLPLTWQLFHTKGDNSESLTESAFVIMNNILYTLANLKTPV